MNKALIILLFLRAICVASASPTAEAEVKTESDAKAGFSGIDAASIPDEYLIPLEANEALKVTHSWIDENSENTAYELRELELVLHPKGTDDTPPFAWRVVYEAQDEAASALKEFSSNSSLEFTVLMDGTLSDTKKADVYIASLDRMRELGELAALGDLSAIDEIERQGLTLYSRITNTREQRDLVRDAIRRLNTALEPLGVSAGEGNEKAMRAIRYAGTKPRLRAFISDPLGVAAKKGNKDAVYILINPQIFDITPSDTFKALEVAASSYDPRIMEFLISAVDNPDYRIFSRYLRGALAVGAYSGNQKAIDALKRLDAYIKAR